MDTESTLIGIGLLLIFIAPIAFILVRQTLADQKHKDRLVAFSRQHNLELSKQEFLSNLSIGLDETSGKLLILELKQTVKDWIFDLKDLQAGQLLELFSGNTSENHLDSIREIILDLRWKNSEYRIVFFDDSIPVLEKEARLNTARKWHLLLNNFKDC